MQRSMVSFSNCCIPSRAHRLGVKGAHEAHEGAHAGGDAEQRQLVLFVASGQDAQAVHRLLHQPLLHLRPNGCSLLDGILSRSDGVPT